MKYFEIQSNCTKLRLISPQKDVYNPKLTNQLKQTKNKIDSFSQWEYYKKLKNKYELIYTNNRLKSVTNYYPISRSYFKLCEILHDCHISFIQSNILCMAEAPGGFLDYIGKHVKYNNCYANTLVSDSSSVPGWNYNRLKQYPIEFTNNRLNDGNLLKLSVHTNLFQTCKQCSLITADGGVDFSNNFNQQEIDSYELIYSEIKVALSLQKKNGTFILKLFDILHKQTLNLIYLLSLCYETIIFIKPKTSRQTNSEKYIVCKNHRKNSSVLSLLTNFFNSKHLLNIYIPKSFFNQVKRFNTLFIQNQINQIEYTLDTTLPADDSVHHCIEWCQKYNIPIKETYLNGSL